MVKMNPRERRLSCDESKLGSSRSPVAPFHQTGLKAGHLEIEVAAVKRRRSSLPRRGFLTLLAQV
jgi:hypothetical protein